MKISNRIEILFLEFLGKLRLVNFKNLVLKGKLKLPINISHEFTVKSLGQVLLEVMKRIEEIMPQKGEAILVRGARDAGREVAKELKEFDSKDIGIGLDLSVVLFMNSLMMEYERISSRDGKTIYQIRKCPLFDIELEGTSYVYMMCEGFCQGVADVMAKGSIVKMNKIDKYYELIVKPQIESFFPGKTLQDKELLSEKLNISPKVIHQFAIKEFCTIGVKMGKRVMRNTTPETYKTILFWGARDAGREVGKMIKRFGVKGEDVDVINVVTYLSADIFGIKWIRIKKSERKIVDHVLECPFGEIFLKEGFPEGCMFCEGYCQGSADVMGRNFMIRIPKKLTTNDNYCKFIYLKK